MWQRTWEERDRSFRMLAVAQDVQGEERVRPVAEALGIAFPVLVDRASTLARSLAFRIVPTGFLVDAEGIIRYRHVNDFDVGDPRVRWNLDRFLEGEPTEPHDVDARMSPEALERFAEGVSLYESGDAPGALRVWREALSRDPDNFLIRSQIWVLEHPERFYPLVDRAWQELQLLREGYDKPLP